MWSRTVNKSLKNCTIRLVHKVIAYKIAVCNIIIVYAMKVSGSHHLFTNLKSSQMTLFKVKIYYIYYIYNITDIVLKCPYAYL